MIVDKKNYNKLNLGCGNRFMKDWTNVDFDPHHSDVLAYDLLKGIPFADNSFNVVYHSHVLEHFSKKNGIYFLRECFRVLKPNGIIRVVVPDLKQIAQEYLNKLSEVLHEGSAINQSNYEWSVIELIDQMVREESGGEMMQFWKQKKIINEEQVFNRLGFEFTEWRNQFLKKNITVSNDLKIEKEKYRSLTDRWKKYVLNKLGVSEDFFKIGLVSTSGEKHKWMYDEYSLKKCLINIGFKECTIQNAFKSAIENWPKNMILDVHEGMIRKPDSLFMEARKIL